MISECRCKKLKDLQSQNDKLKDKSTFICDKDPLASACKESENLAKKSQDFIQQTKVICNRNQACDVFDQFQKSSLDYSLNSAKLCNLNPSSDDCDSQEELAYQSKIYQNELHKACKQGLTPDSIKFFSEYADTFVPTSKNFFDYIKSNLDLSVTPSFSLASVNLACAPYNEMNTKVNSLDHYLKTLCKSNNDVCSSIKNIRDEASESVRILNRFCSNGLPCSKFTYFGEKKKRLTLLTSKLCTAQSSNSYCNSANAIVTSISSFMSKYASKCRQNMACTQYSSLEKSIQQLQNEQIKTCASPTDQSTCKAITEWTRESGNLLQILNSKCSKGLECNQIPSIQQFTINIVKQTQALCLIDKASTSCVSATGASKQVSDLLNKLRTRCADSVKKTSKIVKKTQTMTKTGKVGPTGFKTKTKHIKKSTTKTKSVKKTTAKTKPIKKTTTKKTTKTSVKTPPPVKKCTKHTSVSTALKDLITLSTEYCKKDPKGKTCLLTNTIKNHVNLLNNELIAFCTPGLPCSSLAKVKGIMTILKERSDSICKNDAKGKVCSISKSMFKYSESIVIPLNTKCSKKPISKCSKYAAMDKAVTDVSAAVKKVCASFTTGKKCEWAIAVKNQMISLNDELIK